MPAPQLMKRVYVMIRKAIICAGCLSVIANVAVTGSQPITLQSKLLKTVDGSFINANIIEVMRKFQRKLLDIMIGDQDKSGKRTGRYLFEGKLCGAHELTRYEEGFKKSKEAGSVSTNYDALVDQLRKLLSNSKRDFVAISSEFRVVARGSKPIIAALIEESCSRRGRPGSLLCVWARTKEADEDALFNQHVKTFNEFSLFCADLLNFLGDLIHSCPRANTLFMARVDKWARVREHMPAVMDAALRAKESEFCTYIRKNHLDTLALKDITLERVRAMAVSFKQHAAA